MPLLSGQGPVRPGHRFLAGAPLLIAHRGGGGLAPENTLAAFERAVSWWEADVLELDVQPTRDGDCVVFHDPTLERTTDGAGPVAERTVAELRELDAGYRFSPDGGASFPFRGRGVGISTFAELLAAFPRTRVNVEIKDARAQEAIRDAIASARAEHRVLVAAGDSRNRARLRDHPGPVSAGVRQLYLFYAFHLLRATRCYRPTVDAFQMPERTSGGRRVLGPRWIAEAHALNVAIHVWTVDEVADMRRLLAWGVDGIVTDRPDRLARVFHERCGRPLPPGPPPEALEPWLERLLRA